MSTITDKDFEQVVLTLESIDLHQQALDMIERQEDKIENPEWLAVTSKIDTFPEQFASMEDDQEENLYKKIKDRIIKMMRWLSNIISSSLSNLLSSAKSFNYKSKTIETRLKKLKPEEFETTNKSVIKNQIPLIINNGNIVGVATINKVNNIFEKESTETFSAMEGALTKYKENLNLYLKGSLPSVPKLDLFDTLRSTSNFKGDDQKLTSVIPEINYSVEINKDAHGAIEAFFFSELPSDNNDEVPLPSKSVVMSMHSACLEMMKISQRYTANIDKASSALNKVAMEITAVVNSISPENEDFQDASSRLMRSRDFNQKALFSSIKTFIQISRYNLKYMDEVGMEILRVCETASHKQAKEKDEE